MIEEKGGFKIINVRQASWYDSAAFGQVCSFEDPRAPFPQTGVRVFVLQPGKPNCRYHREGAQEDLLVLSGTCRLLVNEEERVLEPWDYVHLPPGVSHVCIGEGTGPCAVLMIGHRPENHPLYYPESALARKYDAQAPEPTSDPKVAYGDVEPRKEMEPPPWPLP